MIQSSIRWLNDELGRFELGTSEFFSRTAIINHADRMHKEEVTSFTADWSIQYKYEDGKCINEYYNEKFNK